MAITNSLTVNMKTALSLLIIFLVAIILAFLVTIITGTTEMRLLSIVVIMPLSAISLVLIFFCRRRKMWGYLGASILGAFGVILRVAVSTQPNLEVGGGLPPAITTLYIILGALLAMKSFESALELRNTPK